MGRGEELATLRGTWDLVSSERRPTLVTMFGPAGIGKSRLAHELAHRVEASGGNALRGRSVGYGDTGPYSAFAQHVAECRAFTTTMRPRSPSGSSGPAPPRSRCRRDAEDELAEHLAILSGLPVEGSVADRETLFFSARLFLEAVARERPTLLVFEDLHFANPSLVMDLVEFLTSRVQDVPLLLVVTARPGVPHRTAVLGRRAPRVEHALARAAQPRRRGRPRRTVVRAARAGRSGRPRRAARGDQRREPAVHRGAHGVDRRAFHTRPGPAAEQHPQHRGGEAGLVARTGAERDLRRGGRGQGVLARCPRAAPAGYAGPVVYPRVARATRPDPTGGELADQGRAAVRLQARVDPRGSVPDAPARGPSSLPTARPPSTSRR